LDRRLTDKVHLCPSCGWHTLNFVEVCPRCRSLDIEIENVIHHFACAYVGPWSEFKKGVDLVCPKCNDVLRHLGMDYERPSDTYVCRGCGYVFTDSAVEGHCFRCKNVASAPQLSAQNVYEYMPNPKSSRAVEYGRIQGLDLQSVLFEERSRTFRRDFLIFEIDREIYRARRYKSPLSLALIAIQGMEAGAKIHGATGLAEIRREVFEHIASTLRDLDVVSAVNDGWAAVLLPETPLAAATTVTQRLKRSVSDFQSVNLAGPVVATAAVGELLEEHETGTDFFEYVHQVLAWALENRPGSVVSADTWTTEVRNA
jgi:GGDEF domain-containing protein/predicted Zn-ribbon and HTH transcriptional regulator